MKYPLSNNEEKEFKKFENTKIATIHSVQVTIQIGNRWIFLMSVGDVGQHVVNGNVIT